jgi:hypothetical protein
MNYFLNEIRVMPDEEIMAHIAAEKANCAKYAFANPSANMRAVKNLSKFEQIAKERASVLTSRNLQVRHLPSDYPTDEEGDRTAADFADAEPVNE